jgi:sugar lactone lactonase YvrE
MVRFSRSIPVLASTCALMLAAGCSHCPPPAPVARQPICMAQAPAPAPLPVPRPAPAVTPAPAASDAAATSTIVIKDAGLQTPECVLWDADQDVYFVSNINGDPTAADQNGFISKIGPDGKIINLKFVDGNKKRGELNAPKGMAIAGDILYVADLDVVRKFDRKSGKPKGKITVKGSVFLNALALSPDGKVLYVSDSAVKINEAGFAGTGADAIYEIVIGKRSAKPLIQDKALHWPNGMVADESGLWVVTLGRNELIHVNYKGELGSLTKLPKGGLDGIVRLADGSFLISSWDGSAIYRGLPGGEFTEVLSGLTSPASIGLDSKRHAVLIPVFMASAVEIHTLPVLPLLAVPTPPVAPSPVAKPTATPGSVTPPVPPVPPNKPATPPPAPLSAPAYVPAPAPAPASAAAPAPAPAPATAPAPAPAAAPAPSARPVPVKAPAPASGPRTTRWQ